MSKFLFVENKILQTNLDTTFSHIVDLTTLAESEFYKDKYLLASSLRKTIIIHTASIVEALLLLKLKQKIEGKEIKLSNEWIYSNIKILHKLSDKQEVVAGHRIRKIKNIDRIYFDRIIDLSLKYRIINKKLFEEVHKLRKLRNRLHIGGLTKMEKEYTKSNLNFVFNVAKKVKNIIGS